MGVVANGLPFGGTITDESHSVVFQQGEETLRFQDQGGWFQDGFLFFVVDSGENLHPSCIYHGADQVCISMAVACANPLKRIDANQWDTQSITDAFCC
jgi:hypothetical protein